MAKATRSGSFATDTYTDIITLQGYIFTSGRTCALRKIPETSGYQITTNKAFYVSKVNIMWNINKADGFAFTMGYADNDVGMNSATALTNGVSVIGDIAS